MAVALVLVHQFLSRHINLLPNIKKPINKITQKLVVFLHQIQSIESSNLHDQRSSTIARGFNLSHRPNLVRPFCSFRKKETCLPHSNPLIPQKRHLFGGFTFYGKVSDDSSPERVANQKTNLSLNRFIRVGKRGACKQRSPNFSFSRNLWHEPQSGNDGYAGPDRQI